MTSMIDVGHLLERVDLHGVRGFRFWDAALQTPIDDGLIVTIAPASARHMRAPAKANHSGVYAFAGLPDYGAAPFLEDAEPRAYRVDVNDPGGRFLPASFETMAPAKTVTRTLGVLQDVLFPGAGGIVLFSAPARRIGSEAAFIRVSVYEDAPVGLARIPAQYALLIVEVLDEGGDVQIKAVGAADQRGEALICFPHPAPPAGDLNGVLPSQHWDVRLSIRYTPKPEAAAPMQIPVAYGQASVEIRAFGQAFAPMVTTRLGYGRGLIDPEGKPVTPQLVVKPA